MGAINCFTADIQYFSALVALVLTKHNDLSSEVSYAIFCSKCKMSKCMNKYCKIKVVSHKNMFLISWKNLSVIQGSFF